jgi:hypothetical protein
MTQPSFPQAPSRAKVFILTGQWGGGKSVTSLSYVFPTWKGIEDLVKRIVIDPEMRNEVHRSLDGRDYPDQELFGFTPLCEGRFDPHRFVVLMQTAHAKTWKDGAPQVIIIDDAGIWQENMFKHWGDKVKAIETARIYGLDQSIQQLLQKTWRPTDPGVISLVFKRFFEEFILDLREQNISLIVTAPLHNIWAYYGSKEYDAEGKPRMKILGKSAKVLDVFVKHADVIWSLDRVDPVTRKASQLPTVTMDAWNPKMAFPGVPEQFKWQGWPTLWKWHRERTYKADLSKITVPEPEFDQEAQDIAIRAFKVKLYDDLKDVATIEEINAVLTADDAPAYTVENHKLIVEYVTRAIKEKKPA